MIHQGETAGGFLRAAAGHNPLSRVFIVEKPPTSICNQVEY